MTVLHNVARSLVSMVRSSGIRKDYMIDDNHGWFSASSLEHTVSRAALVVKTRTARHSPRITSSAGSRPGSLYSALRWSHVNFC